MARAGASGSFFTIMLMWMLVSCNGGPKPINYGTDGCHFCSMTIVDTQHAAQLVTKKGRAYKFDAIECMMNHMKSIDHATIATVLVNDYNDPGKLIKADKAYYLYSKEVPSPMGEFLSAFDTKESIADALAKHKGEQFDWEALKARFKVN